MENNNGANPLNNNAIPQTFVCDQCGKEFPSEKALRGHRMHHFRRPRAADVAPPQLEEEGAAGPRRVRVLALECPPDPNPIIPWSGKGKRGRGPTKPVVSSDEAHAVSDANVNEMYDMLTQMIRFVSSRGEDDPAAASSSSSKRLRPDFHLARGLSYDEATDTVSFSRRALLSREQDDHPSNGLVVDREADDGKEVEEGEEKEGGRGGEEAEAAAAVDREADDDGKEGEEREEEEGREGGEEEAEKEAEEEDGGGGGDRNGGGGGGGSDREGGGGGGGGGGGDHDGGSGGGDRNGGGGGDRDGGGGGSGGGDHNGGGGGDRDGGGGGEDGAGPSGEGPRDICNLNKPYVPDLNGPYVPENDD